MPRRRRRYGIERDGAPILDRESWKNLFEEVTSEQIGIVEGSELNEHLG